MFGTYATTSPDKFTALRDKISGLQQSFHEKVSWEHLQRAKDFLLTQYAFLQESVTGIADFHAQQFWYYNKDRPMDYHALCHRLDQVTLEDFSKIIYAIFSSPPAFAALHPESKRAKNSSC